mmetsp:Transcript_11624/g.31690  ORF Transcript_11624/g.31690 Transcript_11624/m.31690 type:complete len:225 (-) Transcript_11624:247-921(-)
MALCSASVAASRVSSGSVAPIPATTAVKIWLISCGVSTSSLICAISSHTKPMASSVAWRVPGMPMVWGAMLFMSEAMRVGHSLRGRSIAATAARAMAAVCLTSLASVVSVASRASRTCCLMAGSRATQRACSCCLRASSLAVSIVFSNKPAIRLLSTGLVGVASSVAMLPMYTGKFCSWNSLSCSSAALRAAKSTLCAAKRIGLTSMGAAIVVYGLPWRIGRAG